MFVANFVVQLDNFWTAGGYFNELYFINFYANVCLILVFSFCRLNRCCLILSLAQTQNLKVLVIRSAEIEHQIRFSISGTSKFWEVGKTGKEVTSYEGKGSLLTKDLITWFAKWYWCFLWLRQENNKLVGSLERTKQHGCCWKGMPFAKLPCQNRQYNYQIYWTQFYQGNNFYNNYNKK